MNEFLSEEQQKLKPKNVLQRSEKRRSNRRLVYALLLLIVCSLLLLVTGCATSPPPCEPAMKISQPAIGKSAPSQSYLISAQNDTKQWRETLKSGGSKP